MRATRPPLVAAGVIVSALLLSGCGDLQPDDLGDLFDRAREAIDEIEDTVDDTQPESAQDGESEFDEKMSDARENWDSYQEPPPDLEPLDSPYASHNTDGDGAESATEEYTYGAEYEETVVDYYSQEYGSEPAVSDDGRKHTWEDGDSTTTVRQNFDNTVSVTTTWYKP